MKYQIHLAPAPAFQEADYDLVKAATTALEYLNAPPGDVTLVLTDENQIHQLNMQFAGIDQPTDVLAFQDSSTDPETGRTYYGDVVIALPVAQKQADDFEHTLMAELTMLTVHGILHLLDFDHTNSDDRRKMWNLKKEILAQLDCEITIPE